MGPCTSGVAKKNGGGRLRELSQPEPGRNGKQEQEQILFLTSGGGLRPDLRVGHREGDALLQVQRQAPEGTGTVKKR